MTNHTDTQNINRTPDMTYAQTMVAARVIFGIDLTTACRIDNYTKRYQSAAGEVDVVMWGENQWYAETVEPLTNLAQFGEFDVIAHPAAPVVDALDQLSLDYTHGYGDAVFNYPRHNGRSSDYQAGYDAGLVDNTPTPTEPRPDCTLCGGDGINAAGGASCPACNGSGYETPLPTAQDDDIAARLDNRVHVLGNVRGTELDKALYQAAADEIRRLRDQLNDAKNDAQMMTEKYQAAQADAEKARGELFKERGAHAETTKALQDILAGYSVTSIRETDDNRWIVVGRSIGVNYQSTDFATKEQAQADADLFASRHDDRIRKYAQR